MTNRPGAGEPSTDEVVWQAIQGWIQREDTCHLRQRLQAAGADVSPLASRQDIIDLMFFHSDKATLLEGLKQKLLDSGTDPDAMATDHQLALLLCAQQNRRAKEDWIKMQKQEKRIEADKRAVEHSNRQRRLSERQKRRLADGLVKQALAHEEQEGHRLVEESYTRDLLEEQVAMLREDDMLVQQEAATRKHRAEADAEFWRPQEHTPEWQHTPSRKTRFVMHPLQGFLPLLPKCYSKGYHMAGHATGTFPAPRAASCGGANWRAYGSTHGHPRVIIRSSSTQRLGIDHPDPWLRQYNIRQKALRRTHDPTHKAALAVLDVAHKMHSKGNFFRLRPSEARLPQLHFCASDQDMYDGGYEIQMVKQAHIDQQVTFRATKSTLQRQFEKANNDISVWTSDFHETQTPP